MERYVLGGPRDGAIIDGEPEVFVAYEEVPAIVEQGDGESSAVPITYRRPHSYRACSITYGSIGLAMDVFVSEEVPNEEAAELAMKKLLSGWPCVRPMTESEKAR